MAAYAGIGTCARRFGQDRSLKKRCGVFITAQDDISERKVLAFYNFCEQSSVVPEKYAIEVRDKIASLLELQSLRATELRNLDCF